MHLKTTREVAQIFNVSPRRVLALAEARGIKGYRFGGSMAWTPEHVEAMRPKTTGLPRTKGEER